MVLHCTLMSSFSDFYFSSSLPITQPLTQQMSKVMSECNFYCGRWKNIPFPFLLSLISNSHSKGAINCHKQDDALGLSVFLKFNAILFCTMLWVKAIPRDCVFELTGGSVGALWWERSLNEQNEDLPSML